MFYQQRLQALAEQQQQAQNNNSGLVMPDGTAAKH
jgi:preprotein translocase subunit SecB